LGETAPGTDLGARTGGGGTADRSRKGDDRADLETRKVAAGTASGPRCGRWEVGEAARPDRRLAARALPQGRVEAESQRPRGG